jgi:23S rRNA pseudouridine2605 synthase
MMLSAMSPSTRGDRPPDPAQPQQEAAYLHEDAQRQQGERLQKVLATLGLGSRRSIEEWIRDGRIRVNDAVAQLGTRVLPRDRVTVDGNPVALPFGSAADPVTTVVLGYHKPVGEVTTRHDPQGRPTVFERLPPPPAGRWIVVGRLDVNTSGLLLFTTDGELAHRLMHPSSEVEREYLVRVRSQPTPATLDSLRRGIELEDGWARFDRIEVENATDGHAWFRVVLHEGRNREVRRLWRAVGHEVSRLMRLRYGPVSLPRDLRPGESRLLPPELVEALRSVSGAAAAAGQHPAI